MERAVLLVDVFWGVPPLPGAFGLAFLVFAMVCRLLGRSHELEVESDQMRKEVVWSEKVRGARRILITTNGLLWEQTPRD